MISIKINTQKRVGPFIVLKSSRTTKNVSAFMGAFVGGIRGGTEMFGFQMDEASYSFREILPSHGG